MLFHPVIHDSRLPACLNAQSALPPSIMYNRMHFHQNQQQIPEYQNQLHTYSYRNTDSQSLSRYPVLQPSLCGYFFYPRSGHHPYHLSDHCPFHRSDYYLHPLSDYQPVQLHIPCKTNCRLIPLLYIHHPPLTES